MTISLDASVSLPSGETALRDKALDPVTGDLLQVDGDQVWASGAEALVSDLRSRLLTFEGEWFLNSALGMPWYQDILGQRPSMDRVTEVIRAEVLKCPGIVAVPTITATADARQLTASFTATSDWGALVTATLTVDTGG